MALSEAASRGPGRLRRGPRASASASATVCPAEAADPGASSRCRPGVLSPLHSRPQRLMRRIAPSSSSTSPAAHAMHLLSPPSPPFCPLCPLRQGAALPMSPPAPLSPTGMLHAASERAAFVSACLSTGSP